MNNEEQYLNLLRDILTFGEERKDRTNTGTISLFGQSLTLNNIEEYFPLLTTKKVSLKSIFEELMWMLRGQTNAKILNEKGVKIWNGNSSKEFLKSRDLNYVEGIIGPGYGYQWRSWNGDYPEMNGIDQIKSLLKSLKEDPMSRRHILTAWNVSQLDQMALPPCHMTTQFYISKEGLEASVYIRSNDMFLGNPYNIAFYSLLLLIFAKYLKIKANKLVVFIGDAHVYSNHIDQVKEQLTRTPLSAPQVTINKELNSLEDILALEYSDLSLTNYEHHPALFGKMAV